jgi:hypothetical protein
MTQCTQTKLHALLNSWHMQPDGGALMSSFVREEHKSCPPLGRHSMKVTIQSDQGEVIFGHGHVTIGKNDGRGSYKLEKLPEGPGEWAYTHCITDSRGEQYVTTGMITFVPFGKCPHCYGGH